MSNTQRAPPRPEFILRGHSAAIHSVCFTADNAFIVVGDADGWLSAWDTTYKRPVLAWQAHKAPVLGLCWWETGSPTQEDLRTVIS
jgi:ASTRA-associated protein 1